MIQKTDIWTFKNEPTSLDEMVLEPNTRKKLEKTFTEVPNVCLIGPPGVGKGTFTHIFLKKTALDYIWVNCSDETSIDNVRTKVKSFATSLGLTPLKIVVLNEIDYLSLPAQAMLRDLMEQVKSITRFVLMANYGHKIMPELLSRCQSVELGNPPVADIARFVAKVLKKEGVKVEKMEDVLKTIKTMYPDMRKIINTLQYNTVGGVISSVTFEKSSVIYGDIFSSALTGDLDNIRKILHSNTINYAELYQHMFDNVDKVKSPGDFIILIGEHLYRDSIIAIKEINFMAFVVTCMKKGII